MKLFFWLLENWWTYKEWLDIQPLLEVIRQIADDVMKTEKNKDTVAQKKQVDILK